MSIHFSSATDMWATPQAFFDALDVEFGFDLDVCATADNNKCADYFTAEQDGLAQDWRGVCWMNPPYGRAIGEWMRKAHDSAQQGATVVCLVPSRTDTGWWHDYATKGEIRFIRGRLRFGDAKNSAPFPSAVVVFRPYLRSWRASRDKARDRAVLAAGFPTMRFSGSDIFKSPVECAQQVAEVLSPILDRVSKDGGLFK